MGVYCIARKRGKKCQIVIDTENNAAHPLLRKMLEQPEYAGGLISGGEAFLKCQPGALLVVVDTNRPESVESEEMLETCRPPRCWRAATGWRSSTTTAGAAATSRRWR